MRRQLARSMNDDLEIIGRRGSRGAPFKVRLVPHGYTVFAKCSPEWFAPYLQYEAKAYDRLESIQGIHVPVHLGDIELEQPYLLEGFVMLSHAMFLSFGGTSFDTDVTAEEIPVVTQKIEDAYREIHRLKVLHNDVACRNVLFDRVTGQVVLADFERSTLVQSMDDLGDTSPHDRGNDWSRGSGNKQICGQELNTITPESRKRKTPFWNRSNEDDFGVEMENVEHLKKEITDTRKETSE